jgi:hypothetical protein
MVTGTPVFYFSLKFFFYPFHKIAFSIIHNELTVKSSPPTRVNPTSENYHPPIKTEVFIDTALNVE